MSTAYFTIDAALLAELGERLIGAPHIALAELAKNSYDADANTCRIIFGKDSIEVIDDGHGMSLADFKRFWLKLGTQHKREDELSPILERPFTGSKGVGRLAAQFLATKLELWTTTETPGAPTHKASVDWSNIKSGGTLRQVPVRILSVPKDKKPNYPNKRTHGTRIVLTSLRKKDWNASDLEKLGNELWSLRSPFSALRKQKSHRHDPLWFDVDLQAPHIAQAQEQFDKRLRSLTQDVWRVKITGEVKNGRQTDLATISLEFREAYPPGAPTQVYRDSVRLSKLKWKEKAPLPKTPLLENVGFTIFVYKLEGRQPSGLSVGDLREYLDEFGNVSVYDTGFRLPYYGMDNDWLEVAQDYSRRLATSRMLASKWKLESPSPYLQDLPEPRRLFGAVEINTNREARAASEHDAEPGEWLLIQSSRDRLHPNMAYAQLQALVRYSLDLYANRYRARLLKVRESERDTEPTSRKYSRIRTLLESQRASLSAGAYRELLNELADAERAAKSAEDLFDARTAILAPLASAGMTALGLTHELARETRSLERARSRLAKLGREHDLPDVSEAAVDLGASLSRLRALQNLFAPLLSEEDRAGGGRLRVKAVVAQVVDAMKPLTQGLKVEVEIPDELRFPAGPFASWNAILQNVLANSWNATLDAQEAKVRIEGYSEDGEEWLWISDTGVGLGVDLEEAKRFFDAFERKLEVNRDRQSIAIGGSGMGLAIVRILSERHGVTTTFVEPLEGYATTLELWWKG